MIFAYARTCQHMPTYANICHKTPNGSGDTYVRKRFSEK